MIPEFVAIGTNFGASAPPSGSPWSTLPPPTGTFFAVASNGALVVAVGVSVCQTFDGTAWTTRTIPAGNYRAIIWTGKLWVAVGDSVCSTSPDGITWTSRTIPAGNYRGACWSGSLAVAVCSSGTTCATSPDGITWTSRTINPSPSTYIGVAWNGSVFAAVGVNICSTSPDGITWTSRTIPAGTYNSIAWNGTIFSAVGVSVAVTSPDGITWTSRTIPAGTYYAIAWSGVIFSAVGVSIAATSPDGISWSAVSFPASTAVAEAYVQGLLAQAKDTHRVRGVIVVSPPLSAIPLVGSSTRTGDALNRATWTITDSITGASSFILKVQQIDSITFDVFVAEDFTGDQYTLACPALVDTNGNPLFLAPGVFTGNSPVVQPTPSSSGQSLPVDLKNAIVQNPTTIGGTLVIGPDGDYVVESGESLLKKLILRRLTTAPGAFFHIPTYGLGLQEKTLVKPATLGTLKRQIEQQVTQEPELQDVSASIVWVPANGILEVRVSGTLIRTGQPFTVSTKLPLQT